MNTVEYLFNLENKHTFFPTGIDDLKTFFSEFDQSDKELIEKEFTSYLNLTKEEFIEKLESDLNKCTLKQMTKLADLMATENNVIGNTLTNAIRKSIFHYAIRNFDFDYNKYFKVIVLGIVVHIKQDLYSDVFLLFHKNNDNASVNCDLSSYKNKEDTHFFNISEDKIIRKSPEQFYFNLIKNLYHEQYHALVGELSINPNCYKTEILEYQKTRMFFSSSNFYNANYYQSHEEAAAEIYSFHKTIQLLKELTLDFNHKKNINGLMGNFSLLSSAQFATTFKTGLLKREEQQKFINKHLDELIKQNPNKIHGMLKRIYNLDGIRKSFQELVLDFQKSLENEDVSIEEIKDFYIELLYESLGYYSKVEIEELEKDEYLKSYLQFCYLNKERLLKDKITKIMKEPVYSISANIKRNFLKKKLMSEQKKIRKKITNLQISKEVITL